MGGGPCRWRGCEADEDSNTRNLTEVSVHAAEGTQRGRGWTRSRRAIHAFPESVFIPGERGAMGEGRCLTGVGAVCRVSVPTVMPVIGLGWRQTVR